MARSSIGYLLSRFDSGYHADATIKRGRQVVARVYMCDRVSPECIVAIRKEYPEAHTGKSRSEYAPEMSCPCVVVPTDAEMRRRRDAK